MDTEPANQPAVCLHPHAFTWRGLWYVLFAVIGPIYLSVLYYPAFGDSGIGGYPFSLPMWSYSITAGKILAMIAWLCLGVRLTGKAPTLRWSIAVVFLVGGLHAWCCVGFNARAVLDQGSVNIVSLGLAVLAGVMYLRAFYEVFEGLPDTRRLPDCSTNRSPPAQRR
ncbi:MAG: hypothetical protein NT031_20010 [Planctomycetota bacterium]|nr:hypothetical protein [Planctomycetota bacterium]